jgi:hypothetical protein
MKYSLCSPIACQNVLYYAWRILEVSRATFASVAIHSKDGTSSHKCAGDMSAKEEGLDAHCCTCDTQSFPVSAMEYHTTEATVLLFS